MIELKTLLLLALFEGAITVNVAVAADQNELDVLEFVEVEGMAATHQNEPNGPTPVEKSKQIRNGIVRTYFAALPDESNNAQKTALDNVVLQIHNIRVPLPRNLQKTAAPAQAAPVELNIAEQLKPQQTEKTLLGEIDGLTLDELAASAKDPNSIAEPLAIAQTLYNAGHYKEAAIFYEIAATRKAALDRVLTADDKAWILLQLAACHRDDPEAAIGVLNRLIGDYPKSIWVSAASAKRDILQWYQKDKPRALLESGHD